MGDLEWKVVWQRMPFVQNPQKVLFLKAASPEDAEKKALSDLERLTGLYRPEFRVRKVVCATEE